MYVYGLCVNTERFGFDSIALRHGASAVELSPWPSHSKPVGCEPHGTTAVCLPARVGAVFVSGASRCEIRVGVGEVADPGTLKL